MNRPYRVSLAAASFLLALAGCGHSSNVSTQSAAAQSATTTGGPVLVKAGTVFYGKLAETMSSKSTPDGTAFQLIHVNTLMHHDPALDGVSIDGHVENVTRAGLGKKPGMTIVFDDIAMPNGAKAPIEVKLVSMRAFGAKSHHLRTLGMMIGGSVAGHMVAGKHHGGMMGAAGGYVLSQEMKTDINVKRGTVLEVRFLKDASAAGSPAASN